MTEPYYSSLPDWQKAMVEWQPSENGMEPDLTYRTLADIDDAPQQPLLLGLIEPTSATMLYAPGGTGKGSTVAWIICEILKIGLRPLIYDAEGHPEEWRSRVEGLGGDISQVVYLEPHELPEELLGKPLDQIVPFLAEVAKQENCNILIIDSILAAANLTEEGLKSDAAAPYRYTRALGLTGLPSISIGHTPKNSPDGDCYGSVSWTNAPRLTFLGSRAQGDGHNIRWTPRKRNQRGKITGIILSFEYNDDNQLCGVTKQDDEQATSAWLTDILARGPQTVEELAEIMVADEDGAYTPAVTRAKEVIRRTLNRMRKRGLVHKDGKRSGLWCLGASVSRNGGSFDGSGE